MYKYVQLLIRRPRLKLLLASWILLLASCTKNLTPLPDLSSDAASEKVGLHSHWSDGDIIVLVRHVDRCDHSQDACLDSKDGITVAGKNMAIGLGDKFRKLGLDKTDVYTSPLKRATQTSSYIFNKSVTTQNWLADCKENILQEVLQHKSKNRNLVLVTHSECFIAFDEQLKFPSRLDMHYGASVFIFYDGKINAPEIIGYMNADDGNKSKPE